MLEVLDALGLWSIRWLWVPLVLWSAGAAAVLLAARSTRLHPSAQYRLDSVLLWSLPSGLTASGLPAFFHALPAWAEPARIVTARLPEVSVALTPAASAPSITVLQALGLATVALMVWSLGAFGVLGVRAAYTYWRCRRLEPVAPATVTRMLPDIDPVPARIVTGAEVHVPFTLGWLRPQIAVPPRLLDDAEALRLALAHELEHVRRRDFVTGLAEQMLAALFVFHPLVRWLCTRTAQGRELRCDAALVARPGVSRRRYASLLVQFAHPQTLPLALSMGASFDHLHQRIVAMQTSTTHSVRHRWGLRLATLVLLAGMTTLVACSDLLEAEPTDPTPSAALETPAADEAWYADAHADAEVLPQLEGGLRALAQNVHYPELAKLAGVEGRVIVEFVVDETGTVRAPRVVKGIGSGCDEAALAAVEAATFSPGLQDGEPVKVKLVLPISFKLPATS